MSKPTGDSLHNREKGFWGNSPAPALTDALVFALISFVLALLLALLATAPPAFAEPAPRLVPPTAGTKAPSGLIKTSEASPTGRWIVAGEPGRRIRAQANKFGATAISAPHGLYEVDERTATGFIKSLRRFGAYRYSEPDVMAIPESSSETNRIADSRLGQWWLEDINRPRSVARVTDESPAIALLESSLDPKHPDLIGLRNRPNRLLLNSLPFGDGRDARGTAAAALAASLTRDKDKGEVTGVWPGMRVRLVDSNDSCTGKTRAVYRAARNRDNRVLAMGYSFPGQECHSHYEATEYAVYRGLVPVAAAGNPSSADATAPRPAGDPHVLTVTASSQEKIVPAWAGRGPWVDLTAPGDGLRVAWVSPGKRAWSTQSGTEYSATIVAAAVAWVMQARPKLKARQVIKLLTNAATPLPMTQASRNPTSGHGLLNLAGALRDPAPVNDPLEPNDDIDWVRAKSAILDGPSGKGKRVNREPFRRATDKKRKIVATLGRTEDPTDVYRIEIAPKKKVLVTVTANGRTNLKILKAGAKSITDSEKTVLDLRDQAKGTLPGWVGENPTLRQLTAFVALEFRSGQERDNFSYRLSVESCPVARPVDNC